MQVWNTRKQATVLCGLRMRQFRPLSERPALTRWWSCSTGVDEAANGDAEAQSDAAARVDAAPAGDAAPPAASHASADQPATRLVNAARPSRWQRRLPTSVLSNSFHDILSFRYKVLHQCVDATSSPLRRRCCGVIVSRCVLRFGLRVARLSRYNVHLFMKTRRLRASYVSAAVPAFVTACAPSRMTLITCGVTVQNFVDD